MQQDRVKIVARPVINHDIPTCRAAPKPWSPKRAVRFTENQADVRQLIAKLNGYLASALVSRPYLHSKRSTIHYQSLEQLDELIAKLGG